METYNRRDYAELAFSYRDPLSWFAADNAFVKKMVPTEKGEYRQGNSWDWYKQPDVSMPDMGYPKSVDQTDAFVEWDCVTKGLNIKLKQSDIRDFASFGYTSEADMVQRKIEYLSHRIKIAKEAEAVAFFEDANNFDAALINAAAAVWSSTTTSNPITDVMGIRAECKHLTHMAFNYTTLINLVKHPVVLDNIYGSTGGVTTDPWNQIPDLEKLFGFKIIVFMADVVANSSLPDASKSLQQLFGNYVVFYNYNPAAGANPDVPTWAKEYVYDVPELSAEGWVVQETVDQRAGYNGVLDIDVKYCNQYKVYAKSYGAKLTGVY